MGIFHFRKRQSSDEFDRNRNIDSCPVRAVVFQTEKKSWRKKLKKIIEAVCSIMGKEQTVLF